MAYDPSALPIRERILRNIEAALATIAPPTYANTVRAVHRYDANGLKIQSWPAAIVHPVGDRNDDRRLALIEHEMDVDVGLVVNDQAWRSVLETLIADARVALTTDHTLGGLALTTQVRAHTVFDSGGSSPAGVAQLSVTVLYRTLYLEPTTAV